MDRKNFFNKGLKGMLGDFMQSPVGQLVDKRLDGISNVLAPAGLDRLFEEAEEQEVAYRESKHRGLPRPPGAIASQWFDSLCTRCGKCEKACPYQVIIQSRSDTGPLINPNESACRMCEDFPCIKACPEEALTPLGEDELPGLGRASLKSRICLNHPDNRSQRKKDGARTLRFCQECLDACPVEGAVRFSKEKRPRFSQYCTGCGLCVHHCPPDPKALHIRFIGT